MAARGRQPVVQNCWSFERVSSCARALQSRVQHVDPAQGLEVFPAQLLHLAGEGDFQSAWRAASTGGRLCPDPHSWLAAERLPAWAAPLHILHAGCWPYDSGELHRRTWNRNAWHAPGRLVRAGLVKPQRLVQDSSLFADAAVAGELPSDELLTAGLAAEQGSMIGAPAPSTVLLLLDAVLEHRTTAMQRPTAHGACTHRSW